jgi:hypothetical protein
MNIVVDTSVIIAVMTNEPHKHQFVQIAQELICLHRRHCTGKLARRFPHPLVSLDSGLLQAARRTGATIIEVGT